MIQCKKCRSRLVPNGKIYMAGDLIENPTEEEIEASKISKRFRLIPVAKIEKKKTKESKKSTVEIEDIPKETKE